MPRLKEGGELGNESISQESSGPSSELKKQRSSELEQPESRDGLSEGRVDPSDSDRKSPNEVGDNDSREPLREEPLPNETGREPKPEAEKGTLDQQQPRNEELNLNEAERNKPLGTEPEKPMAKNGEDAPLDIDVSEKGKNDPLDLKGEPVENGEDQQVDKVGEKEGRNAPLDIDDKAKNEVSLQYGEKEAPVYDPNDSDLKTAQDDLDFAKSQMEEYKKAVESGEIEADPQVEQQLQDSIDYSNQHLNDIQNGQAYSYDKPSEYWASPEGREIAGEIYGAAANGVTKAIGKAIGSEIPRGEDSVKNAATSFGKFYGQNYGYKHIGRMADTSQDLMSEAHRQYDTPGDKYRQSHPLRNADGDLITAEEGRSEAFGDKTDEKNLSDAHSTITPEQADALRERINEARKIRAEHPSGYNAFDKGETNILTDEPAKLSSKNFDRLAQERGYSPEEAADKKYSMQEYKKPNPELNGAEHHPDKAPEQYATARHILEPEQAYNYNSGVVREGKTHASTGEFLTPDIQTAPGRAEQAVAQENLALGKYNDARIRSDTTINPTLSDGRQHNVIEGTVAPQNTEDAAEIFKAGDNLDRHGGAKQIITDGGFGSGAVTEGATHNIGDMETDLNNPNLFAIHARGEYGYSDAPDGKSGFGQLDNSKAGVRDARAQRMAGGDDRRPTDDGGHYIANIFNGDPGSRNLDAQDRNLNRGAWKAMENAQNVRLNDGDLVFTNNRSNKTEGSDRPDSYDAYTIVKHKDGTAEAIQYHFENEPTKKED